MQDARGADERAELRLAFNGPQSRAYKLINPGHTVAIPWGRGVGKSWFIRTICYLLVAEWDGKMRPTVLEPCVGEVSPEGPGVRIVILMPTMEQFRKVHLGRMLTELSERGPWGFLGGVTNKTSLKVTFPGGSWIQVVSAEAAHGALGMRCDVVMPDEADDIDPEVVETVAKPWFTEPHSLRITLLGGTPRRGRFGLLWRAHNDWPAKLPGKRHSVHATYLDAPRQVSADFVAEMRATQEVSETVYKREFLCDFDSGEGAVYPMFTPTFHVREPNYGTDWSEILVGVDHGWEDPGVFVVCGVIGQGKDAIVHAIEEVYEQHRDTSWWVTKAAELAEKYGKYDQRWYFDPSRPDRLSDIRGGIRKIHGAEQTRRIHFYEAENAIEPGVDAVADRIVIREREGGARHAKLYVSAQCKNGIREFGLYRRKRDPRNKERILDDIEDKNNHWMDAVRYAVLTRFGGPDRRRHEQGSPDITRSA